VRDIEKTYGSKVGLLINYYLLAGHILISSMVFEIQGFEKSRKHHPPLILGKCFPDRPTDTHTRKAKKTDFLAF